MSEQKTKLEKLKIGAFYIGKEEIIAKRKEDKKLEDERGVEKLFEEINLRLQNYLKMDNVSFLFGTGPSMPLGAKSIGSIPLSIEKNLLQRVAEELKMAQIFYFAIGTLSKDRELIQNAIDEAKFKNYTKRRIKEIDEQLEPNAESKIEHKINLEHLLGYLYKI